MEQKKKKEQDVLVVRDEKTGEISVVAGLNKDGTPKRTPARAENAPDFLKFDKHGDVLDNFFTNFFRQCKEPSRFGFYRIAAEQADKLVDVMKELLKDPEANKELLAPHKVDTSAYEKKVQAERQAQTEQPPEAGQQTEIQTENQTEQENKNQEPTIQNEENMEQKQENGQEQQTAKRNGYQPIDEGKINWQELEEKWGIRRDTLEQSGDLTKMLNYGKSDLVTVTPLLGGDRYEMSARLEFKPDANGQMDVVPHFIRKEINLEQEYKGYTFTEEDKKALATTGNLGHTVQLADLRMGELKDSFVSIDRQTKEILDIPVEKVRLRDKIGNTEITVTDKEALSSGKAIKKEIELANGKKFFATLQVHAEQRGIEFVPGQSRQSQGKRQDNGQKQEQGSEAQTQGGQKEKGERRSSWLTKEGTIRPITKWKDNKFTDEQIADYVAGRAVKLENATDKEGNPCTLYLKFNPEKGRPTTSLRNPDETQVIAPSNESRVQVAVNNEGKTHEATKNVKEPLKQGQVAPKDGAQQKQQNAPKKKGMKI